MAYEKTMAQKIDFCDFLVYLGKNTKGGDTTIFLKNYLGEGAHYVPPPFARYLHFLIEKLYSIVVRGFLEY